MVFWQLTVNAIDPALLARFWARALHYQSTPPSHPQTTWNAHYAGRLGGESHFEDRIFDPAGVRPPLWFQHAPDAAAGSTGIHLDVYPTGRDNSLTLTRRTEIVEAEVADLVRLGARVVRRTQYDDPDDPVYFVVMHDPEGNEFCVS